MPRFAFPVAWCAAAVGWAAILGCSLDLNGTGLPLVPVTDADVRPTEASTGAPDGTTNAIDAAPLSDATLQDGTPADSGLADTSIPDGAPPDAVVTSNDSSVDAPVCANVTTGGTCIVVPTGWSIVAFSNGRMGTCPTDFSAGTTDVVEAPNATNACSCGACMITNPPSCDQGTIGATYGTGFGGGFGGGATPATCTTPGPGLTIDSQGSCFPYPAPATSGPGPSTFSAVEYTPPAPTGGSCASPGVADPSQVTYGESERVCAPNAAVTQACSGGQPCSARVDVGYAICIMMPGAPVGCPAGSPFSTPHWVGGDADVACSDCACALDANGCGGTLATFTDGACGTLGATFRVNGACANAFGTIPANGSYRYTPDSVDAGCAATGTSSTTNVALTSPATVCCAQ